MHTLKSLPYTYDALEPFIDARTMEIHHSKHHQGYVDKLNAALAGRDDLALKPVEELLADLNVTPEDIRMAVRNNGGGVANHNLFWQILAKDKILSGEVKSAIEKEFISFEKFKEEFSKIALTQFGSGWAWLVVNNGKLEIMATSNQDSPLSTGKTPILTLDVWEHAYYLKYQNKRADYIEAFFSIINWEKVDELFVKSK
ncbi:superoxide dismutase [Candidatus Falkowbacteria bacterium CG10_big_fil_rev_8_21_14_0_10_37_6]|uniref:Superoxide dismutase n=1 Tax=Candidatus Falkowbacteria bacterium CG10_big_fil_rev_8_21_14_0_10_37_6 TaxID=1974563 RepID=A0A2H0V7C6_9BACT|nr:MAG: superoxide dismutase [Candidatus Falkowbacteria bacterium CG10_big_fil_rev_8_21_14_0_10_37_6]